MKLLLENWRQYIAEDESSYFPWLEELKTKGGEALMGDNFERIGSGAFRVVFRPKGDDEHIIKLIKNPRDSWMNQVESKTGNTYPELFPKTYTHADDWEWVVQESVEVLTKPKIDKMSVMLQKTFPTLYIAFGGITLKGSDIYYLWDDIKQAAKNPYTGRQERIYKLAMKQEPNFVQLSKAISDFGIDVDDLDFGNIGINKEGLLRILDASVFSRPKGL